MQPTARWTTPIAIVALSLYGLLAGYDMRAAILHDHLYATGQLTRAQCDAVLYQARRGDGVARWRACLFRVGVRAGGTKRYGSAQSDAL